jgi:uncharacterized membrane protein YhiD involved in acid resistance
MDFFTIAAFIVYGYGMYWLGKITTMKIVASVNMTKHIQDTLAKATIPVGVLEKIDGQYYLYEKDSTNFLCQAEKLEDIPLKLWDSKKISLAVFLYPEEADGRVFWCVNGKLRELE